MRHVLPRTALLFLVLIAVPRAAEKWTYASSAHFEVYATGGDAQARSALTYFERVHAFFAEFLKLSPRPGTVTRLIVFSGDRQFAPYRPNETAVAYYLSGPDRDFIVMKELDADAFPIVVHEYAHLIIQHSGGKHPLWLNEGLAEFFSTMTPEGSRMSIGTVPGGRLLFLKSGAELMPLDRLFAVDHDSPEYNTRTHTGVFYSQSWALTHMLLTTDRYRAKSDEFLRLMANGASSADVLMTLYGKTPQAIGLDLMNYIRQSQYVYFLANYKSPPQDSKPPTRPADAFEGGLVTANLLANSRNKEQEARAAFEQLAVQKPNDLSLLESRAHFELQRGHRQDAVPYLVRAVEQGTKNASVYRDYAGLDPSKAVSLIEQAFALSPDDLDIRLRYVSNLISQRKSSEALTTLNAAKQVPPESAFRAFQLLANAYLQLNRLDEARSATAMVTQYAKPGVQADYAVQLTKSVDDALARRSATTGSGGTAATSSGGAAQGAQGSAPIATPASRPPQGPLIIVAGRLKNMVCGSGPPILELDTGTETLRLLIDNPGGIAVQTPSGFVTTDLTCGAQDVPIRIGFLPAEDVARKTVGMVRRLDYRPAP